MKFAESGPGLFVPNVAARTTLGRTGLDVCRIGIGGGSGLSSEDMEYAVSKGVNYIFYSSDLHAPVYGRSLETIRKYCGRGSLKRDEIILAAASYLADAEKLFACIADQLMQLRVDHVDVFHWGWVSRNDRPATLVRETDAFVRTLEGRRQIDELAGVARQVADELRCKGYARYLGISTHDRAVAAELTNNSLVDVVMFRYNIAHRGAETDIFPFLPSERPGMAAFNVTHNALRSLTDAPEQLPAGKYIPSYADLYRFVLDRPEIDVVVTGPSARAHIDESLEALAREPLDPRLRLYLMKYGNVHSGKERIVSDHQ